MENTTLTTLTQEQFSKKVEVESAYLMHFNALDRATADKVALSIIQEKFTVA